MAQTATPLIAVVNKQTLQTVKHVKYSEFREISQADFNGDDTLASVLVTPTGRHQIQCYKFVSVSGEIVPQLELKEDNGMCYHLDWILSKNAEKVTNLLQETAWTTNIDTPLSDAEKSAWNEYRNSLYNILLLPLTDESFDQMVFPSPPYAQMDPGSMLKNRVMSNQSVTNPEPLNINVTKQYIDTVSIKNDVYVSRYIELYNQFNTGIYGIGNDSALILDSVHEISGLTFKIIDSYYVKILKKDTYLVSFQVSLEETGGVGWANVFSRLVCNRNDGQGYVDVSGSGICTFVPAYGRKTVSVTFPLCMESGHTVKVLVKNIAAESSGVNIYTRTLGNKLNISAIRLEGALDDSKYFTSTMQQNTVLDDTAPPSAPQDLPINSLLMDSSMSIFSIAGSSETVVSKDGLFFISAVATGVFPSGTSGAVTYSLMRKPELSESWIDCSGGEIVSSVTNDTVGDIRDTVVLTTAQHLGINEKVKLVAYVDGSGAIAVEAGTSIHIIKYQNTHTQTHSQCSIYHLSCLAGTQDANLALNYTDVKLGSALHQSSGLEIMNDNIGINITKTSKYMMFGHIVLQDLDWDPSGTSMLQLKVQSDIGNGYRDIRGGTTWVTFDTVHKSTSPLYSVNFYTPIDVHSLSSVKLQMLKDIDTSGSIAIVPEKSNVNIISLGTGPIKNTNVLVTFGSFYKSVKSVSMSSTTSAEYSSKMYLSTQYIKSGSYRIGMSAQIGGGGVNSGKIMVSVDSTNVIHESGISTSSEQVLSDFEEVVLNEGVHIIEMFYKSDNTNSFSVKNAKLEIWRLS